MDDVGAFAFYISWYINSQKHMLDNQQGGVLANIVGGVSWFSVRDGCHLLFRVKNALLVVQIPREGVPRAWLDRSGQALEGVQKSAALTARRRKPACRAFAF